MSLAVLATVLHLSSPAAQACSCESLPASWWVENADGGFIGSLVDEAPDPDAHWLSIYTFEVTEWVKGRLEPGLFGVQSGRDGDSCGFEVSRGAEVAVFLLVEGQHVSGGLCSTLPAVSVRATLRPAPLSHEPGRYLAPGDVDQVLDAAGGVVAAHPAGPDQPFASLHTPCGGSLVAERRPGEVAMVDVASFDEVEVLPFRSRVTQILCEGETRLVVAGTRSGLRVHDLRGREPMTGVLAAPGHAHLSDGRLLYLARSAGALPGGWRELDLSSGVDRFVKEDLRAEGQLMESVAFSPSGDRIALTLAADAGDNQQVDVVVISVATGVVTRRAIDAHLASIHFVDDDRLLVHPDSGGFPLSEQSLLLATDDLSGIVQYAENIPWATHLDGDRLVGLAQDAFKSISISGGAIEVLAETTERWGLVDLVEPFEVASPGSAPVTPADVPVEGPAIEAWAERQDPTPGPIAAGDAQDEVASPGPSEVGGGGDAVARWALVSGAITLAAAVAALVLRRRRRHPVS